MTILSKPVWGALDKYVCMIWYDTGPNWVTYQTATQTHTHTRAATTTPAHQQIHVTGTNNNRKQKKKKRIWKT